jgi:hypothetical protein
VKTISFGEYAAMILRLGKRHRCSPGHVHHHTTGRVVLEDEVGWKIAQVAFILDWTLKSFEL